jgi:very-short-patch-repair endonuclease
VTTPARTLVDLAGCLSARELDDHLSAARRLGFIDPEKIRLVLGDLPGRRGRLRLEKQIRLFEEAQGVTRSELETRFLRLCLDGGLPLPEADVPIASTTVDFYWHEQRLIVEVDSRAFHTDRFDEDRIRDLAHLVNGYRTVRVTHVMMERAPGRLIESLRRLLKQSAGDPAGPVGPGVTNGR